MKLRLAIQERARVRMKGRRKHIEYGAIFDDSSCVHDANDVGMPRHEPQIMSDEHQAHSPLLP